MLGADSRMNKFNGTQLFQKTFRKTLGRSERGDKKGAAIPTESNLKPIKTEEGPRVWTK